MTDTTPDAAPHLNTSSRTFDAKAYIRRVYADATHVDIEHTLLQNVAKEAETTAAALKELIRDSMGTFIDCKEAMDVMYANDTPLFTGEAVDPIADAFESALSDGENLLAPTVELFEELRASRITKEILAKLMTVWRVPGVIYEYCGVRVPQRRSDLARLHQQQQQMILNGEITSKKKSVGVEKRNNNINKDESKNNYSSRSPSNKDSESDNGEDKNSNEVSLYIENDTVQRIGRGALEELADGSDTSEDYVLFPEEELFHWYGTPLARRRNNNNNKNNNNNNNNNNNISTSGGEGHGNYEAAVLSLRRAMLYLEENYDLENATVLGVEVGEEENPTIITTNVEKRQNEQEGITLTYRYALALLRATLYLNDQMARELRYANADDTVLIEDALSAMMDIAIAAVKLRHFCCTARMKLQIDAKHDVALSALRQELQDGDEMEDNNNNDVDDISLGVSPSGASFAGTDDNSSITTVQTMLNQSNIGNSNSQKEQENKQLQRMEHPVEYYVRITRNQHVRMMESTALHLSHEASEWKRKFMPSDVLNNNDNNNNNNDGDDDNVDYKNTSMRGSVSEYNPLWSASFAAPGGLLGNANDSFTLFNAFSGPAATTPAGGAGNSSITNFPEGTISERIKVRGFGVDVAGIDGISEAESVLEAFRTPETDFARFTTFSIGNVEMSGVLECSAAQLEMCASGLLQQLLERADMELDIPAAAALAASSTFADKLFSACVDHLELVLVSYWGGIAAAVHAGVFDFFPDKNTALYRMLYGPAVLGAKDVNNNMKKKSNNNTNNNTTATATATATAAGSGSGSGGGGNISIEEIPTLTYIPVVQEGNPTLRQLSVEAVKKGVKSASDILHALLLTSVNRTLLRGFLKPISKYNVSDIGRDGEEDEHAELHAALLVEVILAQWERAMIHVSDAVLRIKVVIGESCTSDSVSSEIQAQEVGELLEELEQLRSSIFRCYTHGVGMLTKAYITLLPSLQRIPGVSTMKGDNNNNEGSSFYNTTSTSDITSDSNLCPRISRDFVSSVLTSKLLNIISVVVDHTAPFLQRFDEVFDGIDIFAAKAARNEIDEKEQQQQQQQRQQGRRTRVLRHKSPKESENEKEQLDPVTAFMAEANSKMVLEHISEHEETLLALIANILLVFVDALHHKCQRISLNSAAALPARERVIVDSLADALCLPTAVIPIIASELISPCILRVIVALTPEARSIQERQVLLHHKEEYFRSNYISRVEEHCQLVVDAMLSMFLATPQQRITREIRLFGFMSPMMDWQRVSAHTAGAVRPYITDSLLHIARANEKLQLLRQPLLAAAVTQRLVAHLALTFATALTVDGNIFEISLECSIGFLTYGLLLIEAEAGTILGIVDALIDEVRRGRGGVVLAELRLAREVLYGVVTALHRQGNTVCEALAAQRATNNNNNNNNNNTDEVMTVRQREARCEAMVLSAMQRSRSLVQAIITYVEDSTITSAFTPLGAEGGAQGIAERLAKRKEGYRPTQQTKERAERRVKIVKSSTEEAASNTNFNDISKRKVDEEEGIEAVVGPTKKVMRKKIRKTAATTTIDNNNNITNTGGDDNMETPAISPRTVQRATVLQRAVKQEERRIDNKKVSPNRGDSTNPNTTTDNHHEDNNNSGNNVEALRRTIRKRRGVKDERTNDANDESKGGVARNNNTSGGTGGCRFKRNLAIEYSKEKFKI